MGLIVAAGGSVTNSTVGGQHALPLQSPNATMAMRVAIDAMTVRILHYCRQQGPLVDVRLLSANMSVVSRHPLYELQLRVDGAHDVAAYVSKREDVGAADKYTFERSVPYACSVRSAAMANSAREVEKHNSDPTRTYDQTVYKAFEGHTRESLARSRLGLLRRPDAAAAPDLDLDLDLEKADLKKGRTPVPPAAWDFRTSFPTCGVHLRDQGSCGSCWAQSSASSFEDRLCMASGGALSLRLSVQQHVSCNTLCLPRPNTGLCQSGCSGGFQDLSGLYLEQTGLVEDAELPYVSGSAGSFEDHFGSKDGSGTCPTEVLAQHRHFKAVAGSTRQVGPSEQAIMYELARSGPIDVSITIYNDIWAYRRGVYTSNPSSGVAGGHAVKLVGYGTDKGLDYWTLQNSWGAGWGEGGFFRTRRRDRIGIESSAWVVTPIIPTVAVIAEPPEPPPPPQPAAGAEAPCDRRCRREQTQGEDGALASLVLMVGYHLGLGRDAGAPPAAAAAGPAGGRAAAERLRIVLSEKERLARSAAHAARLAERDARHGAADHEREPRGGHAPDAREREAAPADSRALVVVGASERLELAGVESGEGAANAPAGAADGGAVVGQLRLVAEAGGAVVAQVALRADDGSVLVDKSALPSGIYRIALCDAAGARCDLEDDKVLVTRCPFVGGLECNGHGACVEGVGADGRRGRCACDDGFDGHDCRPDCRKLPELALGCALRAGVWDDTAFRPLPGGLAGALFALRVRAPCNVTVSTCSPFTNMDTHLALFEGCPLQAGGAEDDEDGALPRPLAANDDSCALPGKGLASTVRAWLDKGDYTVVVRGSDAHDLGDFELAAHGCDAEVVEAPREAHGRALAAHPVCPPRDAASSHRAAPCSSAAQTLALGQTVSAAVTSSAGVLYRLAPTSGVAIELATCGSALDTELRLYRGCPQAGGHLLALSDDECGIGSIVRAQLEAGAEYFLVVNGYHGQVRAAAAWRLGPARTRGARPAPRPAARALRRGPAPTHPSVAPRALPLPVPSCAFFPPPCPRQPGAFELRVRQVADACSEAAGLRPLELLRADQAAPAGREGAVLIAGERGNTCLMDSPLPPHDAPDALYSLELPSAANVSVQTCAADGTTDFPTILRLVRGCFSDVGAAEVAHVGLSHLMRSCPAGQTGSAFAIPNVAAGKYSIAVTGEAAACGRYNLRVAVAPLPTFEGASQRRGAAPGISRLGCTCLHAWTFEGVDYRGCVAPARERRAWCPVEEAGCGQQMSRSQKVRSRRAPRRPRRPRPVRARPTRAHTPARPCSRAAAAGAQQHGMTVPNGADGAVKWDWCDPTPRPKGLTAEAVARFERLDMSVAPVLVAAAAAAVLLVTLAAFQSLLQSRRRAVGVRQSDED
jgi:cathepsin B